MPNHLAGETSPYLRQHQDNPVNWYPWGEEAFTLAVKEHKPIFLSIGYAACHWCHVMAHESFEDPKIAAILNENFISIKVDREERPDLDAIYMEAVVLITGQGGWPMSVFLTPQLKPFYGGTYFPPHPKYNMPSFEQVLLSVIDAWRNRKEGILNNADTLTQALQNQHANGDTLDGEIDLEAVVDKLYQQYDWQYGGWGNAPKFPQAMVIQFLVQQAYQGNAKAKTLVKDCLTQMALGGMYDLVGGGFHRYSVDAHWLVPHFEKMLYDNALLASTYLHAFAVTKEPFFRQIAEETLEFLQSEMSHPDGGFYASLDADTPDGEGRYYTYQYLSLKQVLSPSQLDFLVQVMDIQLTGNFEENLNILRLKEDPSKLSAKLGMSFDSFQNKIQKIFSDLRALRDKRIPPGRDEKVITAWNGLSVLAFAEAGMLLKRDDFKKIAIKTIAFLINNLRLENGRVFRSWSQGKASQPGTLADYAGLICALHAVFQIDFSPEYFQMMQSLFQTLKDEFSSDQALYYDAASLVSNLIIRPRNLQDNAVPSGNAFAAHVHWLFSQYQHGSENEETLQEMLANVRSMVQKYPTAFGYWLQVIDLSGQKPSQVALISESDIDSLQPFLEIYHSQYRPYSLIAAKTKAAARKDVLPGFIQGRQSIKDKPTAYVCQNFTCQRPTTDPKVFALQLTNEGTGIK